jgi:hypothetical protein
MLGRHRWLNSLRCQGLVFNLAVHCVLELVSGKGGPQGWPRLSVHVLTNSRGVPWTTDGFKSSWGDELKRDVFKELSEKQLVFHGLRKSAVVFLLEAGCTDAEVSAITGQSRNMVTHYARQLNQKSSRRPPF